MNGGCVLWCTCNVTHVQACVVVRAQRRTYVRMRVCPTYVRTYVRMHTHVQVLKHEMGMCDRVWHTFAQVCVGM